MSSDLTRADRGVLVFETFTMFYQDVVKNKGASEAAIAKANYDEGVVHLAEATGARFSMPSVVSSITNDERAMALASAIRRAQQFATAALRTGAFEITLHRAGKKVTNMVDYGVYEHLATVTTDAGGVYYFAVDPLGSHVFSEQLYWKPA
jgi:hypothetical protein